MTPAPEDRRAVLAWALYDFGNSAFATTVTAGFFPLFFKEYWSAGSDVGRSTWQLGVANSGASVLVALLAPVLGAFADQSRAKKRLLACFTALGCASTFGLYFVARGDYRTAALCYVTATVGFSGGILLNDALIVSVAGPDDRDRVSALGYALGYLGGGLLFAVNVGMALKPTLFGLSDESSGIRASFATAAVWWAVFTLPLLLRVREPAFTGESESRSVAIVRAASQLRRTFQRVREMRQVWTFLLAYWLYIDAVDTIIRMAVDYGLSLGLPSESLILALLITQFVGFPAAIAFGRLAQRIGTKCGILLGIGVYIGVTGFGYFMDSAGEFYALAVVIGLVQGGVQALSRSFYSRLIPAEASGEFFGFYNMLGKFAAVIGPLLMGATSVLTGNPRLSILSIAVLFLAGGALLLRVREEPAADLVGDGAR